MPSGEGSVSEHTPTPWILDGEHLRTIVRGAESTIIAVRHRLPAVTHAANAAFIVRAVNAHDDLVAALKETKASLSEYGSAYSDGIIIHVKVIVDAALAKVQP